VVICAIALSLAYPVREYIAQRRQMDQLEAQRQTISAQVSGLQAEQRRLSDPAYIEQQARDQLHMCMRNETCYEIIDGTSAVGLPQPRVASAATVPWYSRVWQSVQQANQGTQPH
jgi:cell division protein FtsL